MELYQCSASGVGLTPLPGEAPVPQVYVLEAVFRLWGPGLIRCWHESHLVAAAVSAVATHFLPSEHTQHRCNVTPWHSSCAVAHGTALHKRNHVCACSGGLECDQPRAQEKMRMHVRCSEDRVRRTEATAVTQALHVTGAWRGLFPGRGETGSSPYPACSPTSAVSVLISPQ